MNAAERAAAKRLIDRARREKLLADAVGFESELRVVQLRAIAAAESWPLVGEKPERGHQRRSLI